MRRFLLLAGLLIAALACLWLALRRDAGIEPGDLTPARLAEARAEASAAEVALPVPAHAAADARTTSQRAPLGSTRLSSDPPSTVLVVGGRTPIGATRPHIEALLSGDSRLRDLSSLFVAETPQTDQRIDDFHLMVTEVTNEQYAAYVNATGARPPYRWAQKPLAAAREAFLIAEAERRAAAMKSGEKLPPRQRFADRDWWSTHWRGRPWEIPEGLELAPAVFVDHQDAQGYARWAGMRLMTELEYQRACRGETGRLYPWGDGWEDGTYAATLTTDLGLDVLPVGSFPAGANALGVMDLAGNAWEWTASPYVPLEGYEFFTLEFGHGEEQETYDKLPAFDPDQRVVVGGSVQNPRFMARCTTRGGFARSQQAAALGFRCAASTRPCVDRAAALARDAGERLRLDPRLTLGLDRWRAFEQLAREVPGYEVIAGYEHVLFLPVEQVFGVTPKDLRQRSRDHGPIPVGILSTTQELAEPALPAGTYDVAFLGAGAGVEDERDRFLFSRSGGAPIGSRPCEGLRSTAALQGELSSFERSVDGARQSWLAFELYVPGRTAGRAFRMELSIGFEDAELAGPWRR